MKSAACCSVALFTLASVAHAQLAAPEPQPATAAVIQAFSNHDIVMFGEIHGNKQEYEWLCELVQDPQFAARVDDIVIEFGNSLYQKSVDRYIAGQDVPIEQVQKAQRNMIGAVGPPSPVYANFYNAVRYGNLQRHGKHQIRLVLGDPYGDWDRINNAEDLGPYVANRDQWYAHQYNPLRPAARDVSGPSPSTASAIRHHSTPAPARTANHPRPAAPSPTLSMNKQ